MRRFLLGALVAVAGLLGSATAEAGSWAFHPSVYSHAPPRLPYAHPVPRRGPFYSRPQGAYVNSGYRRLHSHIRVGGQTHDHLNLFESWFQVGAQF